METTTQSESPSTKESPTPEENLDSQSIVQMMEAETTNSGQKLKQKYLDKLGRLKVLLFGAAVKSINRGMTSEDLAIDRERRAYHELLHGDRGAKAEESDMGDLIAGDVKHEHHHHYPPQQPEKNSSGLLKTAGIAAAMLATGGAGAAIGPAINWLTSEKPIEKTIDNDSILDFNIGKRPIDEE